jgi:dienelactone hydrolase
MSFFPKRLFFLGFFLLASIGCRPMDYYLLHPLQPLPGIYHESEFFDRGRVRVHWRAHYPDRVEALPAVLVHPDAGGLAGDMEGICFALAQAGYFAAAVHYQRVENLEKRNPLFPWKCPQEVGLALAHLREHPRVSAARIGLLGFSKGGMLSLLIAAQEDIKAVVAYYPLADFEGWLDVTRYPFPKSLLFRGIRRHFMKELGASTWEEALITLRSVSPIHHVEHIQAPVLLIHGEKDRTAPLEQAQHLCRSLQSAGQGCELFIVPAAGHVFNFRDEEQGRLAWEKTIEFLDRHLKGNPLDGGSERIK